MKFREYDAAVSIGKVFRTVQYRSNWRKGSQGNYNDMSAAYQRKYKEFAPAGLKVHEIRLVK